MPRYSENRRPQKSELHEQSSEQGGYFTLRQANELGFSRQLLKYMVDKGELERTMRGIYRWTYFPPSEDEELIQIWLWSGQEGVFSHETSLFLHHLSDVLPSKIHLSVPSNWSSRRLKVPNKVLLHYADISSAQVGWLGTIKVSKPLQGLLDCAKTHVTPEWIEQAIQEGLQRGLFSRKMLKEEAQKQKVELSKYLMEESN